MVSYTYRREFAIDVPTTLDAIRALGVTDMEFSSLFGHDAAAIRGWLDERDLACSTFGASYADVKERLEEVAASATTLGARHVRVASIPFEGDFTPELARAAIKVFDGVGARLRDEHGLVFCYHNHGFEFVPYEDGTLYDLIVQGTDPDLVSFELDILWAYFPGHDPAQLLRRYPERFRLMHLKDLRHGVVGDRSGHTAQENDVALGDGQLNLPEILRAAHETRIEHYYIEDESPSVADQVPRSLAYLASLRWDSETGPP
jgi:sugar phosphate isomerase/epimerase